MEDDRGAADHEIPHTVFGEQPQEVLRILGEQPIVHFARSDSRTSGASVP